MLVFSTIILLLSIIYTHELIYGEDAVFGEFPYTALVKSILWHIQ
jgi:hypothetical protein